MARTMLKGIEMAGVRLAIEVPPLLRWSWHGSHLESLSCSPLDPDIHVGVRVAEPDPPLAQTFHYETRGIHFEIGREFDGWVVAVHGPERCDRLARFDSTFQHGEVVVSPEWAATGQYPLAHPLDELILLHRLVREHCVVLHGSLKVTNGKGLVFLGPNKSSEILTGDRGLRTESRNIVIREQAAGDNGGKRAFWAYTTAWNSAGAPMGVTRAELSAIHLVESGSVSPVEPLHDESATGELLQYAHAPIHDPNAAERLLGAVECLARRVPIVRIRRPELDQVVSFTWERSHAAQGFAGPPQL